MELSNRSGTARAESRFPQCSVIAARVCWTRWIQFFEIKIRSGVFVFLQCGPDRGRDSVGFCFFFLP